jgi:uncharacterized repeat protein (TIGR03806 family)
LFLMPTSSRRVGQAKLARKPMRAYGQAIWLGIWLAALLSCSNAPKVVFHEADNYPTQLSAWGLLAPAAGGITLPVDSHVYDLNTALFTDYALKLRTLYLPAGASAQYNEFNAFSLPVGSIISKTFFYKTDAHGSAIIDAAWDGNPASLDMAQVRLMETRLLVKQASGWDALPYIWQGKDAELSITGDLISVATQDAEALNYLVPSRNQCASCHATNHTSGEIQPIGIKARHLNRPDPVTDINQLTSWQARGQLKNMPNLDSISANARWADTTASLDHRARSYLDINCGHCHNEQGAADTSGLLLDYKAHGSGALGVCKPPIAAGRGSGGHLYSIVPGSADTSIMAYRLSTTDPGTMMPELGRTLVHQAGHALVSSWIDAMQGVCL